VVGHYAAGALGLDPLDRLNQKPRHARDPDRKDALETQVRKAGGLLLQPQSMHRSVGVAQWRAARTNARDGKGRAAAATIEKNLTHSRRHDGQNKPQSTQRPLRKDVLGLVNGPQRSI
jgi:hypothetical protein